MGWLVARTDMPLRRTIRALVMASFVTPPFLGAIAWEMLAAPNSGLLNQLCRAAHRRAARRGAVRHLHAHGPDLRHLLLHVPLCLHAGRQRARPHAGRPGGRLRDARRQRLAHRRAASPSRSPCRRCWPARWSPSCRRMTLFGSPAILALPGRLPHPHHQDLEPVPVPAQARTGRRRLPAAAARYRAAAACAGACCSAGAATRWWAASAARRALGAPACAAAGRPLSLCLAVLALPLFLPYAALFNAAFSRIPSQPLTLETLTLHNVRFIFFELSATQPGAARTPSCSALLGRNLRHAAGAGDRLSRRRAPPSAAIACWASSPPRRSPFPASCWASACSSPTRARRSCSTARCGSC